MKNAVPASLVTSNQQLPNARIRVCTKREKRITLLLKHKIFAIAFVISNLFLISTANGQTTYTWIGANNALWTTSTNWSPTRSSPATNDILQFTDGTTKNVTNVPTQTIGRLLVNSSTTITIESSGTTTLTVGNGTGDDIVIASGSFLKTGGSNSVTVTLASSATADISGTLTVSSIGTYNTNGTSVVTTVTGTITNSGTVTNSTASKLLFQSGSTYTHAQDGGTIPTATWNAASTCNITGITGTAITSGDGQAFGNFKWNCTAQSATRNLPESGTITIAGNLEINSTGAGASQLRLNQTPLSVVNYTQTGGNFATGSGTARTLTVTGNVSISGGTLTLSLGSAIGTLNVAGDFSQTSGTITETSTGSGLIVFNKSGIQTYTSGGTVSNTINFTVNSGSTLQMAAAGTTVTGGGTFTLSSGATLGITSTAGIVTAPTASGNIQTTTRTFNTGADYIYNNTTPSSQVMGNALPATVNSLTIDNTSGVTLTQSVAISGSVTFTNGILTTTSSNLLTLNAGSSVSGAGTDKFINGPVKKIGNTAFTFPVGKSTVYAPLTISAPSVVTDAFTAEYIRASATALGSITASGLDHISNCEYWQLDRTTGTSAVDLTLSWSASSPCNAALYVNDLATLTVAHFNGSNWDTHGSNGTTGTVSAGTVTRNAVSVFSPFTIGSTSPFTNPLPAKFDYIKVFEKSQGVVQVDWSILTEINVDHYEIERSDNGRQFATVGQKTATGNNSSRANYSWLDINFTGSIAFYRIKAVDIDDKYTFSLIVKISLSQPGPELTLYPNPVTNNRISFQSGSINQGQYKLAVYDMSGRNIYCRTFSHQGGVISQSIQLPASVVPGVYSLQIAGNNLNRTKTFVIQ